MLVFLSNKFFPSNSTLPPVGVSNKFRQRKKVLLPLPEGPIITTTSPASISKSIPLSTSFFPNVFCKFLMLITSTHSPFSNT